MYEIILGQLLLLLETRFLFYDKKKFVLITRNNGTLTRNRKCCRQKLCQSKTVVSIDSRKTNFISRTIFHLSDLCTFRNGLYTHQIEIDVIFFKF